MILNREHFVQQSNRRRQTKLIDVPEMGDGAQLYIRMLNGAERERMELAIARDREKDAATMRARMVVTTACDADGKPLFIESDIGSVLNLIPWGALKRICDEANDFNGLSDEARESLEKNLEPAPIANTSTTSRIDSASPNLDLLNPLPASN